MGLLENDPIGQCADCVLLIPRRNKMLTLTLKFKDPSLVAEILSMCGCNEEGVIVSISPSKRILDSLAKDADFDGNTKEALFNHMTKIYCNQP